MPMFTLRNVKKNELLIKSLQLAPNQIEWTLMNSEKKSSEIDRCPNTAKFFAIPIE